MELLGQRYSEEGGGEKEFPDASFHQTEIWAEVCQSCDTLILSAQLAKHMKGNCQFVSLIENLICMKQIIVFLISSEMV